MDDLNRLHIELRGVTPEQAGIVLRAAGLGHLEAGGGLLDVAALRQAAGPSSPEDWQVRFAAMVEYARTKGRLTGDGRHLRAHLARPELSEGVPRLGPMTRGEGDRPQPAGRRRAHQLRAAIGGDDRRIPFFEPDGTPRPAACAGSAPRYRQPMTDELSAARRRFPRGTRVRGTVFNFPAGPGRAGAQVDIGHRVPGWVDLLLLPEEAADWPPLGRSGLFEVLQHRPEEVRLFPLDAGMRSRRCRHSRWSGPEWADFSARHPVGSTVEATVTYVFPGNREYSVEFAAGQETVEYDGAPPALGAPVRLVVERLSEWTRRLILQEAPVT